MFVSSTRIVRPPASVNAVSPLKNDFAAAGLPPATLRPGLLGSLVVSLLLAFAGCSTKKASEAEATSLANPGEVGANEAGRLIVLGFDGVDPRWLKRYADEGKLPNLKKLMTEGEGQRFRPLGSTNPPQSPVAWTSFATGTHPGDHGIFDFIGRDLPEKGLVVLPKVATTSFDVPAVGPPIATNLRSGIPFWKLLADQGIAVEAINIPYSFPPDPMREGRMLSGLGVPDLRETNSTFTYASSKLTADEARRPPGGGVLVPISVQNGVGRFELEGPSVPGKPGERMQLPVEIRSGGQGVKVTISGQEISLEPREMSPFVELSFQHETRQIVGIARFLLLEAGASFELFITPLSFHPKKPYSPVSYPSSYAGRIADALGRFYKTVGWDHDTSALNAEVIDDGLFLADMDSVEKDRRAMLDDALARDDWKLLVWVSTSTDRVAHMFYRLIDPEHPRYDAELAAKYGDAIENEYRRMDETVGSVLGKLKRNDTLLILSDHGFHNYRRGLHLNQWLRQQGYLALQGGKSSSELGVFAEVDWGQTKAYALGTGQIYVNLRGREREGIVNQADMPALLAAIRDGLEAVVDEERGGVKPIDEVFVGSEVFQGGRAKDAPDLQVAFAENYRTSWETILGGIPEGLFADNDKKWSGDHAASDYRQTPGILLSNRALVDEPHIVDLAPTALGFFGKEAPSHYVGKSVLKKLGGD